MISTYVTYTKIYIVEVTVRKLVANILKQAKTSNLQTLIAQSVSNDNDNHSIVGVLDKIDECLGDKNIPESTNTQCHNIYKPFVNHRQTTSTALTSNIDSDTYSKKNAKEIKILEKRIKKMDQKFNDTYNKISKEELQGSATFPILMEYFMSVDELKLKDCTDEVLAEIQCWNPLIYLMYLIYLINRYNDCF